MGHLLSDGPGFTHKSRTMPAKLLRAGLNLTAGDVPRHGKTARSRAARSTAVQLLGGRQVQSVPPGPWLRLNTAPDGASRLCQKSTPRNRLRTCVRWAKPARAGTVVVR